MPNDVQVRIQGSDETAAAIAQVTARLNALKVTGSDAAGGLHRNFSEARGAAALLGEEVGVKLNRHLRSVLASSSLIGPALEAAFPIAAAIGFGTVMYEAGKKIYEAFTDAEGAKTRLAENKDLITALQAEFKEAQKLGRELQLAEAGSNTARLALQKAFALEDSSGLQAAAEEFSKYVQQLQKVEYQTELVTMVTTTGVGSFEHLTAAAQKAQAELPNAYLQLDLLSSKAANAATKVDIASTILTKGAAEAATAAAKRAAAELARISTAISTALKGATSKIFESGADPIDKIRKSWNDTINELTVIVDKRFPLLSRHAYELVPQAVQAMNQSILAEENKLLDSISKDIAARFKDQEFPIQLPKNLDPLGNVSTDFSGFQRAAEFAADLQKKMQPLITLNESLSKSFDNMFQDIAMNTRGVSDAFASMASSVAASLMQMVAKMIYTATIGKWIGDIIKGMFFASIPSTPVPFIDATLPDHLAGGGRYSAGMPRIVGESGMELDIPDQSGTIIPNSKLSGIGGTSVKVIINNNSSHPVTARATPPRFNFREMVQEVILEDMKTNGPIRQVFGGAF